MISEYVTNKTINEALAEKIVVLEENYHKIGMSAHIIDNFMYRNFEWDDKKTRYKDKVIRELHAHVLDLKALIRGIR